MLNWQLWTGELDSKFCDSLIENFSKIDPIEGTTFNGDTEYRSSIIRWVHGEMGLKDILMGYFSRANIEAFGVDVGDKFAVEMQFTEYDAEYSGKYKTHHDIDWLSDKPYQRKLSMVIQLSDPCEYEGGDLCFSEVENQKQEELKKKGSIIVFPSYLQHAVTEVTKGKRYSLVLWLSGPRWR